MLNKLWQWLSWQSDKSSDTEVVESPIILTNPPNSEIETPDPAPIELDESLKKSIYYLVYLHYQRQHSAVNLADEEIEAELKDFVVIDSNSNNQSPQP